MGKESKDILKTILANQELILKQLKTNYLAITGSKATPVAAKKSSG